MSVGFPDIADGGSVRKWAMRLRTWLEAERIVDVVGGVVKQTAKGKILHVAPAASATCRYQLAGAGTDDHGMAKLRVSAGARKIWGTDFVHDDDDGVAATLTISSTGRHWIYLQLNYSDSTTPPSWELDGDCAILHSDSYPTDTDEHGVLILGEVNVKDMAAEGAAESRLAVESVTQRWHSDVYLDDRRGCDDIAPPEA